MESRQQTFAKKLEQEGLKKSQELQVKRKRKEIDEKLGELVSKYVEAKNHYPDNHMMVVMLGKFLEVASKMQEAIKMIDSMNVVTSYMTELTSFINQSLEFQQVIFNVSMQKKSGWLDQIKADMDRKRAFANMRGTIKTLVANIKGVSNFAVSMTKEFESLSDDLSKNLNFGDGKGVGNGSSGPLNLSPEIAARLNAELQAHPTTKPTGQGGNGGYVPPSNSTSSGSSDYDDVF